MSPAARNLSRRARYFGKRAALSVAAALACSAAPSVPPAVSGPAMLPDRTLRCVLGRATNLDPSKLQTVDDIVYEGAHDFVLFLPGGPRRTGPPPEPADDPEPVDARTVIAADPAGLAGTPLGRFDRVVDLWPERVETISIIDPPLANMMIVSSIDVAAGTASLFMAKAKDAASMDLDRIYQGPCQVEVRAPPPGKRAG